MDKIKIGIPRSIFYYYYGDLWKEYLTKLGHEVIISPITNKQIMNIGSRIANDEMCLSLKNYLGHVAVLENGCDYILIPRIDNYGTFNQTCTNFQALYDILNNLFTIPILHYNIDVNKNETEKKGMIKIGMELGSKEDKCLKIYEESKQKIEHKTDIKIVENQKKLKSKKEKILLVGHPYNIYDSYIGDPIVSYLKKMDVELIYSDLFPNTITNQMSCQLSQELYWKYNKENIGSIPLSQKYIDGIIFLSTFPCGPDSLVNELVMRRIHLPYLNIILDDMDSLNGFETRLESFVDILKERKRKHV